MTTRLKYQYQLIRYEHDQVTGEFVNVGLVLCSAGSKYLRCKVVSKYSRISNFFNQAADYSSLHKTLRFIETTLNKKGAELNELFISNQGSVSINTFTTQILPKDDNSLYFAEVNSGVDYNLDGAFDDIFSRLVDHYNIENTQKIISDNIVWSKYYKTYFDKYGVSAKLKPHKVKTSTDEFTFDKSWKNGSWHCFQALSLSLKKVDSIKNKLYKWSGILDNLENTTEHLHLYFLTSDIEKHKDLKTFFENNITRHQTGNLQITLVTEKEAEKLAQTVQREIVEHEG
ncbi:MAG: hypothetical protein K0S53_2987 [Bacteroidetes bacterium]|jgi:hypothetical protein|nr:hypothetical protein [Bacteroidota bacterium]